VALTPLIAAFGGRRKDEPWTVALRRAWPLGLVTAAWAIVWVLRQGHGAASGIGMSSVPAAFVHLGQVLVGAEWRRDDPDALFHTLPPVLAIGLVVVAVAWLTRPERVEAQRSRKPSKAAGRTKSAAKEPPAAPPAGAWSPAWTGLLWALAGAIPVIAVAPIWSAYFYLFALCGVALTLGTWLKRAPVLAAVAVLLLLGWTSENARRLQEFETAHNAWSVESHVNRFYLDRALGRLGRYLADLKRQRPELPHRSTLYFAGVPSFVGLQAADGPLVRWAYRDSSLRSYYATEFGATPRRGPTFVFQVQNDTLQEITDRPGLLRGMAVSAIMDDKLDLARSILQTDLVQHPGDPVSSYVLAWVDLPQQPAAGRDLWLRAHGVSPVGPPTPEVTAARARIAAGDLAGAMRLANEGASAHGLDPEAHGLLADLIYRAAPDNYTAVIEAYAARVLTPDDAGAWRRWAMMLGQLRRYRTGLVAIRRYFELGGAAARQDQRAVEVRDFLERAQPGGELTQRGLRREMDRK